MLVLATILFMITVALVTVFFVAGYMQLGSTPDQRRHNALIAVLVLDGWLALTGVLAALGALSDFSAFPPQVFPVILVANSAAVVIALSPLGRRLVAQTPLVWLIGFQGFRIAVEIVLALLYHVGIVPVQMTFEGWNWDIVTGITALPVAWLASRNRLPRWGLLLWNLLGLTLLITIVTISILSMPTSLRTFFNDPPNTFISTLPFVWLPTLLVPAALCGHLLVFRYLLNPTERLSD